MKKTLLAGILLSSLLFAACSEDNAETNEMQKTLMAENDGLKIALCMSVIFNIILGLLYLHILFKKRSKKEKNEFDFEIEIEE